MKIKICGMCNKENIASVAMLQPDFLGFIFYPNSKRYISRDAFLELQLNLPTINKVGVFVNENIKEVIKTATLCELDYIQLHGDESATYCEELNLLDFKIIKAFGIDANFDFQILQEYEEVCSYFMFDTKTTSYGGSGTAFNWNILQQYQLKKPIFLSGGIGLQNIENAILLAKQLPIFAIDCNSQLEVSAGIKDIEQTSKLISYIRNNTK